ncbi:hypothetical protein L7F22_063726 [Adiantum nelumboides]|nr:hypothetical protein [Adiantum nelumboides]
MHSAGLQIWKYSSTRSYGCGPVERSHQTTDPRCREAHSLATWLPSEHLLHVHCSDLEFDAEGASTGWFCDMVTNAQDKENIQRVIREDLGQEKVIVYFGDDQPDALALLDADLGIVIGATDALCTLLRQHLVQLRPLRDAADLLASGAVSTFRQSGILVQADDWKDVSACLF